MDKHKELYLYSRKDAERSGELDLWTDSYRENCVCARDIEKAIEDGYANNRLSDDCAKKVIEVHGFERVNWVLAHTIADGKHDGRYSAENKKWAESFYLPREEKQRNSPFLLRSHPGLVDIFTNEARREWNALGLYDNSHCYDEKMDYTDKVVVIDPKNLQDEYKKPEYQLFYATGGFGCKPDSLGRKVYGQYLTDGAKGVFYRGDFLGVMKLDLIPDWAQEKVANLRGENEQKEENGPTMRGMNGEN